MASFRLLVSRWDERVRTDPDEYMRHVQGDVFEVPDDQAERLLRIGAIAPVDDRPIPVDDARSGPPVPPASGGDAHREEPMPPPERPKQTASKPTWVEYAVACGMDRADAEALDKRELIAALD